jgi:hypothetical protein
MLDAPSRDLIPRLATAEARLRAAEIAIRDAADALRDLAEQGGPKVTP